MTTIAYKDGVIAYDSLSTQGATFYEAIMSNRQTVISLSTGHAVLTFPCDMDYQDVSDLDVALKLQIRTLKRTTKKPTVFNTIQKAKEAVANQLA